MSEEQQSQQPRNVWMEDKLTGMDMIGDEHFEPTGELYDFLTESCSPPQNNSSLISSASSASTPSSFESSFAESIPMPSPDTEGAGGVEMMEELLSLSVQEKPIEPIDFSELNSATETEMDTVDGSQHYTTCGNDIDAVSNTGSKLRQSRLQTPSKSLKNCSYFSRSPIKDTQLEYLKELRDFDTTKMALSSQMESQLSSGRSSSNDTYIVSQSSSEERASSDTALNELGRSEMSSVGSSVSVEGGKKSKPPKTGSGIARKSIGGFKFTKPTAKPSLLPSKPSEPLKQSKSLLQQPLRKVGVPANKVPAIKKNTSLRNQENKGIPFVTSNPPSKVTKRVPVNKSRIRKSSIPKPVAVSDLRKKQPSKDSVQELNATRVVKSASVPVVHSTPIPLKNKAVTDTTPNRRRSLATNSPTDTGEGGPREAEPRIRPSFSLSSIEGSVSAKKNETTLIRKAETSIIKTPKTVKKRRSLLPTPGGKELNIPPLDIGTSDRKSYDAMQQQSSASPHLDNDKRAMPPPKRSLKPQGKGYGLQKPTAGSRGMVFKPRNGPGVRLKKTGPVKPMMVPKLTGSKVVHSPLNKENASSTPHSKWSPVKKKKDYERDDACFMCTKRTVK